MAIRGYPAQPSPVAGESLVLHVATDAPAFRVEFYRCGAAPVRCGGSGWLAGTDAPPHRPDEDWGEPGRTVQGGPAAPWPGHRFPIPADWPAGAYLAVLVEGDGAGRDTSDPDRGTAYGRDARALFVVRPSPPPRTARILYKLPLLTYHAYGMVDGERWSPATARGTWCIYSDQLPPDTARQAVSVHRPGGGTGGVPFDLGNFDPYEPTPRQTFAHWDHPFLAWLERSGYRVDCCTDLDLHVHGQALLDGYRLLVSAGHDEYWSERMRHAVEAYLAGGGNLAFFSGNTMWWRVVFDSPTTFRRAANWHQTRPENALLGASFRNGGERDRDDHPAPVGYRVQHADHWAFAGTGLRDGDVVGEAGHLVGYECDGADFDRSDLAAGRPVRPSGADGTPPDTTVLGVADLRPHGWGFGNAAGTMVVRDGAAGRRGTVFNAATTDWARVLGAGRDPVVERITRNVLDRLG
ncbi:MAG: N,N-dimethylformamidase beta subunit family domain-containing protein [Mycobacteriales bacterium]